MALTVGMVFHLALRQTEGFLRSLFALLGLERRVPDHTTISRRARKLGKLPFSPPAGNKPVHILVDRTGLKVCVGNLRKPPKNKRQWHTKSGYSRRSVVENTVYRYNCIIGRTMRSRTLQGQRVEARVGCRLLNTMTTLGMPESHQVG